MFTKREWMVLKEGNLQIKKKSYETVLDDIENIILKNLKTYSQNFSQY